MRVIYAIRAVGTEYIKFGKANSVGKRLKGLETACPFELEVCAVADWPDGAELAVHLYLYNDRERGEWFRDGPMAREVMTWMVNGQAGLERLRAEIPIKADRGPTPKWGAISEATATRRAQREAWWKARGEIPASWLKP